MNTDPSNPTTLLLRRMAAGDSQAATDLMPLIYDELHRIADRLMHGQSADHLLQPTALINEAFIKLVHVEEAGWEGRNHFLRTAARAMRSVLIDHARSETAQKRGGKAAPVTLHDDQASDPRDALQVLAVHEGVDALAAFDPQLADIVELRFFGGFGNREIAAMLQVSLRTVERGWPFARAWLLDFFARGSGDSGEQ